MRDKYKLRIAAQWLNFLQGGLSSQKTGFDPRPFHMRPVEDKLAEGWVQARHLDFHLQVSSNQCSIFIHSSVTDDILFQQFTLLNNTVKRTVTKDTLILFRTGPLSIMKVAGQYKHNTKWQARGNAKLKSDEVMTSLIAICGTEAWVKTDTTTTIKIKE